jgi:hypothetical protein
MFIRRSLPVSVILAIILTLVLSVSGASAQTTTEVRLGGSVVFRDADASSDSLTIALTSVPQPAAGHAYEGWLISADGAVLSTGVLTVTSGGSMSGQYVSPSGDDLLAKFGTFAISQEPSPDLDPAISGVIYADNIAADVYPQVVALVTDSVKGLRDQAALLAVTMSAAQDGADLATKQAHAGKVAAIADSIAVHGTSAIAAINNAIAAADESTVQVCDDGTAVKKQIVDCNATAAKAAVNKVTTMAAQAKSNAAAVVSATADNTTVRLRLESGDISATGALDNAKVAYLKSQDIGKLIPIKGAAAVPPSVGDEIVPMLGFVTLLVGLLCTVFGGMMIMRRRASLGLNKV